MSSLSRTLERVRTALLGRRSPGRHSRPAAPRQEAPREPRARLTPAVLGARLVDVRRHRAERAQGEAWRPQPQVRTEWFPPAGWEDTGALVRPYVLSPEERQLTMSTWKFTETSR